MLRHTHPTVSLGKDSIHIHTVFPCRSSLRTRCMPSVSPSMKLCQKWPSGILPQSCKLRLLKPSFKRIGLEMGAGMSYGFSFLPPLKCGHDEEQKNQEKISRPRGTSERRSSKGGGGGYNFPSFLTLFLGKQAESWPATL